MRDKRIARGAGVRTVHFGFGRPRNTPLLNVTNYTNDGAPRPIGRADANSFTDRVLVGKKPPRKVLIDNDGEIVVCAVVLVEKALKKYLPPWIPRSLQKSFQHIQWRTHQLIYRNCCSVTLGTDARSVPTIWQYSQVSAKPRLIVFWGGF